MAIDFPNSPSSGDTYTAGGRTWQWDGTTWKSYGNYPDPTVLKIDPASNRVGINNTSPSVDLDVTGSTAISGNLAVGSLTNVESDITTLQSDMTTAQGDITTLESGATATSIKVYADASARSTAVPSPAAGDLSFLTSTASVEVYDGSAWVSVGGASMITKVARFTASGTWTVPAGVTYAIAHVRAGGGGCSTTSAPAGANSSVALPDGTVTADAGNGMSLGRTFGGAPATTGRSGATRSGQGAAINHYNANAGDQQAFGLGGDGCYEVRGSSVTPGASISVTVGAGGSGTYNGGSGVVWIEYQEPA